MRWTTRLSVTPPAWSTQATPTTLLSALYTGTSRLPQLLTQITSFLRDQCDTGRLADGHGRDVTEQVAMAAYALGGAHGLAMQLTEALQRAQNAVAGLYVKEDGNG